MRLLHELPHLSLEPFTHFSTNDHDDVYSYFSLEWLIRGKPLEWDTKYIQDKNVLSTMAHLQFLVHPTSIIFDVSVLVIVITQ